jgi:hypothetical protein
METTGAQEEEERLAGLEPLLSGLRVATSVDIRRAATIGKQQEAAVDTLNTRGPCRAFVFGARRACRQLLPTLALVRKIIWSPGNQDPFPGRLQSRTSQVIPYTLGHKESKYN